MRHVIGDRLFGVGGMNLRYVVDAFDFEEMGGWLTDFDSGG
jgi:hypothetical protein